MTWEKSWIIPLLCLPLHHHHQLHFWEGYEAASWPGRTAEESKYLAPCSGWPGARWALWKSSFVQSSSQGSWQCSLCSPRFDSHQQGGQEDRCTWYQARNKQMRRRHPSEVSDLRPSCSIRQAVGMWANLRSCYAGQCQWPGWPWLHCCPAGWCNSSKSKAVTSSEESPLTRSSASFLFLCSVGHI